MEKFDEYFDEKSIEDYLIRERAKKAKTRSEFHTLSFAASDDRNQKRLRFSNETDKILKEIFPPRRQWKRPSPEIRCRHYRSCTLKKCREVCKKRQNLNSIEMNMVSLRITINYLKKHEPQNTYILNLSIFIKEIQESIYNEDFIIASPEIIPIPKKIKEGIYRPIAQYPLKDKLIISMTNRYFTSLFDSLFYSHSYAFRKQSLDKNMDHHEAFRQIIRYNELNAGSSIWVSECDMQKFYDTVNHTVIKDQFKKLKVKVMKDPDLSKFYSIDAERILNRFLDSYTFTHDVLPLNGNMFYWQDKTGNPSRKGFKWINKETLEKKYKKPESAKIGIPQGGALSGLIANIVLDYADNKVLENGIDPDLLYIRFCDDIIIMHTDEEKCIDYYKKYDHALREIKLFPHTPELKEIKYSRAWWEEKTKKCYLWSNKKVPWVGFVGYEINRSGDIRVRKSSLKKEIQKQRDWVKKVISVIKNNTPNNSTDAIEKSVRSKLLGMSVGKCKIHNFDDMIHDMCWVNGFELLNDNQFVRVQLKRLDKSRAYQLRKLNKFLEFTGQGVKNNSNRIGKKRERQIEEHFGKPFSYYYHGLRKKGDFNT